jgi:hypothetical protein
MITPAYQLAKKAQAHASDVSSVPAEQVCSSPLGVSVAQSGIVGGLIRLISSALGVSVAQSGIVGGFIEVKLLCFRGVCCTKWNCGWIY